MHGIERVAGMVGTLAHKPLYNVSVMGEGQCIRKHRDWSGAFLVSIPSLLEPGFPKARLRRGF